jgi:hypothetical protein
LDWKLDITGSIISLASRGKLIESICNNPKAVRFADACLVAEMLGFTAKAKGGGSHHAFSRPGEIQLLNFQERSGGVIKPYQARQLISMIYKYWDFEKGEARE